MRRLGLIAILSVALPIRPAIAQDNPNIRNSNGSALAQRACGRCHIVDPAQKESPPVLAILPAPGGTPKGTPGEISIPTFMQIAARAGTSENFLRQFIRSTHWDRSFVPTTLMPPPAISKDEESKIIAYILTLKKPQ